MDAHLWEPLEVAAKTGGGGGGGEYGGAGSEGGGVQGGGSLQGELQPQHENGQFASNQLCPPQEPSAAQVGQSAYKSWHGGGGGGGEGGGRSHESNGPKPQNRQS